MRISQREARRLRKRVDELERERNEQRRQWSAEYPGGVNVTAVSVGSDSRVVTAIRVSRALGHAVVATVREGDVLFHALPLPK